VVVDLDNISVGNGSLSQCSFLDGEAQIYIVLGLYTVLRKKTPIYTKVDSAFHLFGVWGR